MTTLASWHLYFACRCRSQSTWVVAHWRRNIIHPNVISRWSHHVEDEILRSPYQIFQYRSYSDDELLISHVQLTSNATPTPLVDEYDAVCSWQHVSGRDELCTELIDFFLYLPDLGRVTPPMKRIPEVRLGRTGVYFYSDISPTPLVSGYIQ